VLFFFDFGQYSHKEIKLHKFWVPLVWMLLLLV
jgi:hypothetical protein